jgi:hypothetical protein
VIYCYIILIYLLTSKIKFSESWIVTFESVDCVVQSRVHVDGFNLEQFKWKIFYVIVTCQESVLVLRKRFETSNETEIRSTTRKCEKTQNVNMSPCGSLKLSNVVKSKNSLTQITILARLFITVAKHESKVKNEQCCIIWTNKLNQFNLLFVIKDYKWM